MEETAVLIGADSLGYLSVEDAKKLSAEIGSYDPGRKDIGLCTACFDGIYPTAVPQVTGKNRFEQPIR